MLFSSVFVNVRDETDLTILHKEFRIILKQLYNTKLTQLAMLNVVRMVIKSDATMFWTASSLTLHLI